MGGGCRGDVFGRERGLDGHRAHRGADQRLHRQVQPLRGHDHGARQQDPAAQLRPRQRAPPAAPAQQSGQLRHQEEEEDSPAPPASQGRRRRRRSWT